MYVHTVDLVAHFVKELQICIARTEGAEVARKPRKLAVGSCGEGLEWDTSMRLSISTKTSRSIITAIPMMHKYP